MIIIADTPSGWEGGARVQNDDGKRARARAPNAGHSGRSSPAPPPAVRSRAGGATSAPHLASERHIGSWPSKVARATNGELFEFVPLEFRCCVDAEIPHFS